MNKRIFLLLASIGVSLPFWVGVNLLQTKASTLFTLKQTNPNILKAQINPETTVQNQQLNCIRETVTAESFLIFKTNGQTNGQVLLEKNSQSELPIASITKLMTYLVAVEFYKNEQKVIVSQEAVKQSNTLNPLSEGEILKVKELIPIMLIESSNDAAFALSKVIGEEGFLDLMNMKTKEIGLLNTYFYNPTGVDPEARNMPGDRINFSTAMDIAKLTQNLIFNHPEFLQIVSKKEYPLYKEGKVVSILKNTNELIGEIPELIGGKTGTTDRAGECLMVVLKTTDNEYLIGVVLNSKNRFSDMKILLSCVHQTALSPQN